MSLPRNLLASYFGQAYAAVIGIVMLPVYVRYMGAEAYGLVGFFTMLQAWFLLLDLGLTPTVGRELSRFHAGVIEGKRVATMVRSTEWFFGALGMVAAIGIVLAAGWIARDWLKAQQLAHEEVELCVSGMAGVVASRWLVGLYRGGLASLENMVVLNLAGTAIATVRWVGVVGVFLLWSTRPAVFFAYQLIVSVLELIVMNRLFYRVFPMHGAAGRPDFPSLRGLLGLAGNMAFLAGLWVLISQTDKLVLSWALDLHRYGFFTIAVTLAGGISLLSGPMGQVLQPRFTVLAARGDQAEFTRLYRRSTQVTCAAVFAVAGVMACFPRPLLLAWTGNREAALEAARVLPLYALGNAVATLLVLAFMIQFAHGRLRWHVIGNCLFALIWFPGVYFAATRAGAMGTGWVWLGGNLVYLFGWLPYIYHRLVPGLWWRWLLGDVGLIVLAEAAVLAGFSRLTFADASRLGVGAILAVATAAVALVGLLAGTETRPALFRVSRSLLAVKPA